jgi:acyl carrier protein
MAELRGHGVETIANWLASRIAAETKQAPEAIALDEPFAKLGLDSLKTLIVSRDLGEFLGLEELQPSLFWDYPTITKLAEHLAETA